MSGKQLLLCASVLCASVFMFAGCRYQLPKLPTGQYREIDHLYCGGEVRLKDADVIIGNTPCRFIPTGKGSAGPTAPIGPSRTDIMGRKFHFPPEGAGSGLVDLERQP